MPSNATLVQLAYNLLLSQHRSRRSVQLAPSSIASKPIAARCKTLNVQCHFSVRIMRDFASRWLPTNMTLSRRKAQRLSHSMDGTALVHVAEHEDAPAVQRDHRRARSSGVQTVSAGEADRRHGDVGNAPQG